MRDRNFRIGSTLESLLREDGVYEDVETEAIASVLAYRRGSARAESDEPAEPGDSPSRLKSARRAPSVAGAGSGRAGDSESERAGGVCEKHELRRVKVPERELEMRADMDDDGDLRRLAELRRKRRTAARLSSLREPE